MHEHPFKPFAPRLDHGTVAHRTFLLRGTACAPSADGGIEVASLSSELESDICLRKKPWNELVATSARAKRRRRRPASSCARRFTTSARASTAPDRPSRRLRSGCRKPGARESGCLRRHRVPRLGRSRARRPPRERGSDGRGDPRRGVRVRSNARSSVKAVPRRRARRSRGRPTARPDDGRPRHAAPPPAAPPGRRVRA